jgi:hypothetical protein
MRRDPASSKEMDSTVTATTTKTKRPSIDGGEGVARV